MSDGGGWIKDGRVGNGALLRLDGRPMNDPGFQGRRDKGILKVRCMNVRGCKKEENRAEVVAMCMEEGLDILAINEEKLKGKQWIQFGLIKGLVSGVNERVRAKEGIGLLMKEKNVGVCMSLSVYPPGYCGRE